MHGTVCSLKVRLWEEAGQLASLGSPCWSERTSSRKRLERGQCLFICHWGEGFLLQGVLPVADIYRNRPANIDGRSNVGK